jgi:hypothetical protein
VRDALRLDLLAWLLAGMLAANPGSAGDLGAAALDPGGKATRAAAPGLAADVDAFLEPWRRVLVARLIPDHARSCVPVAVRRPATSAQRELARNLEVVAQSALGAWLIGQAAARAVLICHDPSTRLAAYYRAPVRLIGVLTQLADPARIMFLAHELAHVLQHPEFSNDRRFGPAALLLLHRVREAAAEAIATRVLWQLRARGYRELFDYKLQSAYGDIAQAFARAMAEGRGAAAELGATRAAFEQWFERAERVRRYDDHLLDHIERVLPEPPDAAGEGRRLTDAFLRGLGRHAGATFLPAGAGRPLTDPFYARGLAPDRAARREARGDRAQLR